MKTARSTGIFVSLVVSLVLGTAFSASAQQVYIANESQSKLQLLNLSTNQFTTLYNIGGKPDDMTLNASGQLLYTVPAAGTLNLWDPVAQQNTVLASNLKWARDLEIEPGGQTMLIGIYAPGEIMRYNFATQTSTLLIKKLGSCDGITYDPYGNLYAVANHNTIIQINPTTGAIINTLVLEPHKGVNGGDGLTYDSFSGSLWATHDGTTGAGLLQIPISPTGFTPAGFTFYPSTKFAAPDGIKSDGKGNLYVGSIATFFVYNIPTQTVTKSLVASGADGVSLVPGTY
jgi:hypothetical protein